MGIETEAKLLDINYIETRLRDIKEIRNKEIFYNIEKSNRPDSKSIYVYFHYDIYTTHMRISDHSIQTPVVQFIVNPFNVLNKKKKELFMRTLLNSVKCLKHKALDKKLKNLS